MTNSSPKTIEERLNAFENIINKSNILVIVASILKGERIIEFVSQSFTNLGYNPRDFYDRKILFKDIIVSKEYEEGNYKFYQAVAKQQENVTFKYQIKTKDQKLRWVLDSTYLTYNSDGEVIRNETILYDITEQVDAEQNFTRLKQINQDILELMNEAVVITDENDLFTFVNQTYCNLLGYDRKDMIHAPMIKFVHPDYRDMVNFHLTNQQNPTKNIRFESKFLSKEGEEIDVLISPKILFTPAGAYEGTIYIITNITAIKNYENELIHLKNRYLTLFEASKDALFLLSDEEIEESNQMASEIFACAKTDLIGKKFWQLASNSSKKTDNDRLPIQKYIESAQNGKSIEFQGSYIRFNGKKFDAFTTFSRIFIQNEPRILVLIKDLSQMKYYQDAFTKERDLLRTTLSSIQDGVISLDPQGKILLFNKMAEKLTDWKESEVIDKHISDILKFYKFGNPEIPVDILEVIQKQVKSPYSLNIEKKIILVTKFTRIRKISFNCTSTAKLHGVNQGYVLVFRDITSQEKLQEEAFKSQKMESIGLLAGGIAHDFNNILTSILGNISIAKLELEPKQGEIKQILEETEKAVNRANKLTKQLLTFSKGGAPIKKVTSLRETIEENAKFALRGSNIKLFVQIAPDLWNVEADEGQIGQCIHNIIINANQAMPNGGNIIVEARNVDPSQHPPFLKESTNYIVISIMDQGGGIPEKLQSKIFDPYFTTKENGTGLGLAIVYSILNNHNGFINLDSKVGEGTIFYLYLPAVKKKVSPAIKSSIKIQKHHGNVIIMDDEQDIRNILGKMLKKLGYNVDFTKDGRELIAFYKTKIEEGITFDFLIIDLTIPGGMGGKEAIGRILEINPLQNVIVTSGYSTDPVMADFESFGFKARLIKPFTIYDLSAILENFN